MKNLACNGIRIAWLVLVLIGVLTVGVTASAFLHRRVTVRAELQSDAVQQDLQRAVPVPTPVLVELFTSEGCSSCPPADALLAKLDAKQPVAGAQVIVLSEHVTYWNRLGWTDPYSQDAMTERQQRYAQQLGLGEVYTPQAVVNGAANVVGSDERGLEREIAKAAANARESATQSIEIVDAQRSGDGIGFSLHISGTNKMAIMAAVAEDSVESHVSRGENADRTLRHVAVVRAMQEMGKGAGDGRALSLKLPESAKTAAKAPAGPKRLVVFLVDRGTGHIVTASERAID